jgi:hypothetical protein
MNPDQSKVKMICGYCGGQNVMRDAWAVWDVVNQEWALGAVFDYAYSEDCNREATLEEQSVVGILE